MFLKLLLIKSVLIVVSAIECDPSDCPIIPRFYKLLGCTPIIPPGECCVQRYECDANYLDDSKCHIGKNSYAVGASVPTNDLTGLCVSSCSCTKNRAEAEFQCAQSDCPELYQRYDFNCVTQDKHNSCCYKTTICDETEIEKLEKCYFEDEEYLEGQPMLNINTCHKCICAPNFDNSTIIGNPNCQEINCTDAHLYAERFRSGCIPVYLGNDLCCPWVWKCPNDKDTVILAEGRTPEIENDPKLTCKFGKLNLKLGDGISDNHECAECKCFVPPLAHCIETHCEVYGED